MTEGVSIVIPVYNAAQWLVPTVEHIGVALKRAAVKKAEIILVNDGSTDDSLAVAKALTGPYPIKVVDQENSGRFLTRKAGLVASKYSTILFIDSRVFIHAGSLEFIASQQKENPDKVVWNGHVVVDKQGNIIARFGDAITFIGWRRYFKNPRTCSYGLKDFDHYPKGTGCFLAPRDVLLTAVKKFEEQTFDIKNSSDDTHLIRLIAAEHPINLSPEFSCTYHARTKLSQFTRHSYSRGKFFVDGFLRPGNRFFVPLIVFLGLSLAVVVALIVAPKLVLPFLLIGVIGWLAELVAALLLGVNYKDAVSLFALTPVFTICYGLGIWSAIINKLTKGARAHKN